MNNAQLINQDSGDFEYYTPIEIVNAAREVMGSIDLDPASSYVANERIKAKDFFDISVDGLLHEWKGNIWMNHPFSRGEKACNQRHCEKHVCRKRGYHIYVDVPSNADWIKKIIHEYEEGNIYQACCITYAATSEQWFSPLLDFPQCFLIPRTNYYLPNGDLKKGVTKGSVVTYFGSKGIKEFREIFGKMGKVKI